MAAHEDRDTNKGKADDAPIAKNDLILSSTEKESSKGDLNAPQDREETREDDMSPYQFWSLFLSSLTFVVGVFVLYVYYGQLREMRKSNEAMRESLQISSQNLAITQRGYLEVEPYLIGSGPEMVACRYRYAVTGATSVTVESGFIRMSIDEPSPEHTRTNPEKFQKPLDAAHVDPKSKDVGFDVTFPALTAEQQKAWSNGTLTIFLGGEIVYRDSFYPTTKRHRKYFGWKYRGGKFDVNSRFVRNDEEDERQN